MLGDGRGHDVGIGVGRLLPEQYEIGAEMPRGGGQHAGRRGDVGPFERRVADQERLVRAQRERLVQRSERALGAHADRRDEALGARGSLLQAHRLFERMPVVRVHRLLARPIEPLAARIDPLGSGRVRHLLDAHGDLQRARSSSLPCGRRRPAPTPGEYRSPSLRTVERRSPGIQLPKPCAKRWKMLRSHIPPRSPRWRSRWPHASPARTRPSIVFPVAGPVISWKDDYGSVRGGVRQIGNAIGVAAGTPVVATASGDVRLRWRDAGGWSVALTTPTAIASSTCTWAATATGGARRPGLRDGTTSSRADARLERLLRERRSEGTATRFVYEPGRRRRRRPVRAAGERTPPARRPAARPHRAR